jgi:hypothetical protein
MKLPRPKLNEYSKAIKKPFPPVNYLSESISSGLAVAF